MSPRNLKIGLIASVILNVFAIAAIATALLGGFWVEREARGPRDGDLPAYVSNGLIGLRVREMPLRSGMALVSGVVGEHPESRTRSATAPCFGKPRAL